MNPIKYKPLATFTTISIVIVVLSVALTVFTERRVSEVHLKDFHHADFIKDSPGVFAMGLIVGPFAFFTPNDGDSVPGLSERYNLFEVGLWGWIGLVLTIYSIVKGGYYRNCGLFSGMLFLSFSLSDAIEIISGAWWAPRWLLFWKCANITAFVFAYLYYRKINKAINKN